ncbi:acyl carrier protein [Paenibacillus alvei]|uniref:Acyl carrier protein n=1 Tax=Paenibacillus alvei TaxID=44250 RepID=A0ABT4GVW6_PAEAL|nr:acyl carrier protein [Paenibacillus alvei]MCY9760830.1 acyl carrier protein [Paenibacillus alvei]MCY9768945.1 acyl carrier protein [Paenibacillus alvei]
MSELDIHAPFYELGADSLNKMQVISRIREMYPISLNVQELYAAETISELADIIELAYIELLEKEEEEGEEGEEKTHDQSAFVSTT